MTKENHVRSKFNILINSEDLYAKQVIQNQIIMATIYRFIHSMQPRLNNKNLIDRISMHKFVSIQTLLLSKNKTKQK